MSRPTRGYLAAAVTLGVALVATACSGGDDDSPPGPSSSAPAPISTTVKVGAVEGALPAKDAKQAADSVAAVVDGWLDAAFVGGDYPRDDFADAFPGFTKGAAAQASQSLKLMSNADIGSRIDGVTVDKRAVAVDLLGVKKKPEGATARVRLVFDTTGDVERKVAVTGRLMLTPDSSGTWQIFGFDVAKGKK
ncbi:MAG: hypothetical protein QM714_07690 [Nocardioides sp.]|uniref:hypothetical protein n=1 Tax=Nocardioides sp. TaxID=35761 RepID=UPI0039E3540D